MGVKFIQGGLHVDQRGVISFVNDFDVSGADRFYTVRSHEVKQVRGWVGHRREYKWFMALSGTLIVAVVEPDDWEMPSSNLEVKQFVLSVVKPGVLHVPPGHVTASIMLTSDALLGVFSSGTIKDVFGDDYRFDANMWKIK